MWNDLMSLVQRSHARMLTFELNREEGQGMVEYALILSLVSVVAVVTLSPLGTAIQGIFGEITGSL